MMDVVIGDIAGADIPPMPQIQTARPLERGLTEIELDNLDTIDFESAAADDARLTG